MNYSKHNQYFLALSLICLIALFSCRKKDERYEGTYVGTERYTELDSGATVYSLDSTYHQEIEVTYDKKAYTFLRIFNNPYSQIFQHHKTSYVNNEYGPIGELYLDSDGNEVGGGGHLKFSGDSMYYSNWSSFNGDEETLEFKGKRN